MKTADIVSSAVVILFGLALLLVIIPGFVPVEAGPGFGLPATAMPYVAAASTLVLAVLFFVHRLRQGEAEGEADRAYDAAPPIRRESWIFLSRAAVFLIAVTALFNWIGFLVAGPPTVAGFMIMMGERRPVPVAVTAIAATAATWLFFWQFLKFPLP